jgi:hypothetical protein
MPDENSPWDPVQVMRSAQAYLKKSRGIERYRGSQAKELLEAGEMAALKCIDHMIGEKGRLKGVHCECDYHQAEYEKGVRDQGLGVGGRKT